MSVQGLNITNPNQPFPPILASDLPPPPTWPLPTGDWVILPVVGILPAPPWKPGPATPTPPVVPSGRITGFTVSAGGTGYTSAPTVTVAGGSGGTFTAVVTGGAVTGITVVNGGSGYTTSSAVTITGGGGSGAAATVSGVTP
jgi:hypothetical protein